MGRRENFEKKCRIKSHFNVRKQTHNSVFVPQPAKSLILEKMKIGFYKWQVRLHKMSHLAIWSGPGPGPSEVLGWLGSLIRRENGILQFFSYHQKNAEKKYNSFKYIH